MMPNARHRRGSNPDAARPRSGLRPVPLLVGLGISLAGHLVVLLLYTSPDRIRSPDFVLVPASSESAGAEGIRVVRIVETPSRDADPPETPTPTEEVVAPEIEVEAPGIETDFDPFLPERYRSAAERIRLGPGSPLLWQPVDPSLLEPAPEKVLAVRLATLIQEGNDSALAEAQELARAMDWTHTDEQGRRWGLSPGMIHLGDVSIPLPFGFGAPYDYSGERAETAFRMNDIQRAAGSLAARQSWRERVEAMRKRREERRAREEATRAATPPVAKPDTTSSRRRRR